MQEVFYEESATLENRKSALRKYNTLSIFQIISIVMVVLWAIIVVTAIPLQDMGKAVGIVLVILPFLTNEMLIVLIIATFIVGLIGAYIGKIVLKKHFEKAGIA